MLWLRLELLRSISHLPLVDMIYLPKTVMSTSHLANITMKSSSAKIRSPSKLVKRERWGFRLPLSDQASTISLVRMNLLGRSHQTSIWDLHLKGLPHSPRLVPVLMWLLVNTMMASDSTRIRSHSQLEKRGQRNRKSRMLVQAHTHQKKQMASQCRELYK